MLHIGKKKDGTTLVHQIQFSILVKSNLPFEHYLAIYAVFVKFILC